MNVEISTITPVSHPDAYKEAWGWMAASPEWRKATVAVFGELTEENYREAAQDERRIDIGVWNDGEFMAIVTLTAQAKDVYEVGFEAKRGSSLEALTVAGISIRERMYRVYGAQYSYTVTPRWNRAIINFDKSIGYRDEGVRLFKGQIKGKPIEWVYLSYRGELDQ